MVDMDAKDRKIEHLERLVAEQAATIEKLVQRVTELERQLAKARKDSSNSSKPPSSDIVKKPKGKGGGRRTGKRNPGARKGIRNTSDRLSWPDQLDDAWDYTLAPAPTAVESSIRATRHRR